MQARQHAIAQSCQLGCAQASMHHHALLRLVSLHTIHAQTCNQHEYVLN